MTWSVGIVGMGWRLDRVILVIFWSLNDSMTGLSLELSAAISLSSPSLPGTGSLTAAVETASGRKALVVGKPNTYMFDCIVERFGIDPSRTLMVGDRLETDILFGKNCGLSTILTLTGVSRLEEALAYMASDSAAAKDMVPNYYVNSIADLIPGLDE